jgi:hypothetical protein
MAPRLEPPLSSRQPDFPGATRKSRAPSPTTEKIVAFPWVRVAGVTASGLFRGCVLLLAVCAACGGKSTVHRAERTDAGDDTPPEVPPDAPDAPDTCAATSVSFGRLPRQLHFAVPRSAAMGARVSADDPRSRYEATTSALLSVLEELDPGTLVGLTLTPNEDGCEWFTGLYPTPLDEGQLERLASMLAENPPSSEASSLALALWGSYDAFDFIAPGDRTIVVFLDDPDAASKTCDEPYSYGEVMETARQQYERGEARPTFVAVPGSEAGELARLLAAEAGCNDCWEDFSYEPLFAERLLELVEPIVAIDYSCDLPLPASSEGSPLDLEAITMTASYEDGSAQTFPRVHECGDGPGFTVSEQQQRLSLCPATCADLTGTARGTLEITIDCGEPTDPPPDEPDPLDAGDDAGPIPRLCAMSPSTLADDGCAIPLPDPPRGSRLDLASVTVTLDGASSPLPRLVECGDEVGFKIMEGPVVVLCRATCTEVRAADATVTVGVCLKL